MDSSKNFFNRADFQEALPTLINSWENDLYEGRVHGFALSDMYKRGSIFQDKSKWPINIIFDNAPALAFTSYGDIQILPPSEIKKHPGRIVILGMVTESIKKQLKEMGLREFDDFMSASDYLSLRSWYMDKKVVIQLMLMIPTLQCTMNCPDCNTLIFRHKDSPRTYNFGEMKSDLDRMMDYVDYLQFLGLMGGEAFLNRDLADFIFYAKEKYRDRIGEISIPSNGTIAVNDKLAGTLKKANVMIVLSDYGLGDKGGYRQKFERTVASLNAAGLEYKIRPVSSWLKAFSEQPVCRTNELPQHFKNCYSNNHCSVFNGARLFPCNTAFSADLCGWIPMGAGDCLDTSFRSSPLSEGDKLDFIMTYLGRHCERGYLSCCEYCYGRDYSVLSYVPLPADEGKLTVADASSSLAGGDGVSD